MLREMWSAYRETHAFRMGSHPWSICVQLDSIQERSGAFYGYLERWGVGSHLRPWVAM